jgi:hypothetical protein
MLEQLLQRRLVQKFTRDTGNQHCIRLGRRRMDGIDQMSLPRCNKIAHLLFNIPQDPERQEPREDEVSGVADGCGLRDVAECELVEAGFVVQVDGIDREEDGPCDEPGDG